MWVRAPGWIGAAEPCWVCCDAGGAPARVTGAYGERIQRISLKMLPVGGGAGAGPPGTAGRRTQQSPQHQGHLVAGQATAPAGRGVGRADPGRRCAARGRGARRGGAVRGAGARCAARGGGAAPRDTPGGAGATGGAAAPGDRPDLGPVARPYPSETPPLKISSRQRPCRADQQAGPGPDPAVTRCGRRGPLPVPRPGRCASSLRPPASPRTWPYRRGRAGSGGHGSQRPPRYRCSG